MHPVIECPIVLTDAYTAISKVLTKMYCHHYSTCTHVAVLLKLKKVTRLKLCNVYTQMWTIPLHIKFII